MTILPSYAWRAALLLAAAALASAGILRSREYDADVYSATTPAYRSALVALLKTSARPSAMGWRRLVALHPSGAERVLTLEDPARVARASALDAGLAAFLAAVTVPLLVSVFATVPSITVWAYFVPAILVGPLMGATVGLSLWRLAVVDRVVGGRESIGSAARRVAGAVLVGYLLGEASSLAQVGSFGVAGTRVPMVLLTSAFALAGATFVTAGLAILAVDSAGRFSVRAFTAAALILTGTLFALVLWAVTTVTHAWDLGGWSLTGPVMVTMLTHRGAAAVVVGLALAVLALLSLRPTPTPPRWAVDGEVDFSWGAPESAPGLRRTLLVGLVAGVAAALTILVFRIATGPAAAGEELAQRFDTYEWVFAGAGAVTAITLLALYGLRAGAAGLLAAPVASATAALGFAAINEFYGGDLPLDFVESEIRRALSMGVLLLVVVSVLGAIPRHRVGAGLPWTLVILSALIGVLVAGGTLAIKDTLSPLTSSAGGALAVKEYLTTYVPAVKGRLSEVDETVRQIDADIQASPAARATRVRAELLAPVKELRTQAAQLHVSDESLQAAHLTLVDALEASERTFANFARAYETHDTNVFAQAQAERAQTQTHFEAWFDAVTARQSKNP